MARKNCPDCGGFEKQKFSIFRCTKCLNRYKARYRRFLTKAAPIFTGIFWLVLLVMVSYFGYTMYQTNQALDRLAQSIEELEPVILELEETTTRLEETADRMEGVADRLEARVRSLEESIADLEQAVDENIAAREELQRLLEELLAEEGEWRSCRTEFDGFVCSGWIPPDSDVCLIETCQQVTLPEQPTVTVEQGDTVWDLLTKELGRYPTWEEIQKVVDANGLESFHDAQGLWIVLVYPGQVLDLTPALGT